MGVAEGTSYKGDHKTGARGDGKGEGKKKVHVTGSRKEASGCGQTQGEGREQEKTTFFFLNENAVMKPDTEQATLTLVT